MPFYSVEHSYPLTANQKSQLAGTITHLHSSRFLTPSVFVHVNFKATDASDQNYFIAGKVRTKSTNRIVGLVRTSEQRTQQQWEDLSQELEEAWYTAVSGEKIEEGNNQGKRQDAVDDNQNTTDAKLLRFVAFHPLSSIWENGDPIPPAGHEAGWLKENREKFQKRADAGDELYQELLEEVSSREDLKKAYGA